MTIDYVHPKTEEIAQTMLGAKLSYHTDQGDCSGYIVETEAYIGKEEAACHADNGKCMPSMNESMQWENN